MPPTPPFSEVEIGASRNSKFVPGLPGFSEETLYKQEMGLNIFYLRLCQLDL